MRARRAPSINEAGAVAYVATLATPNAPVQAVVAGDPATVLARAGETAPDSGGAAFRSFSDPVLSDDGKVAFTALVGTSKLPILFTNGLDGTLWPIAQIRGTAPDSGGAKFAKFIGFSLRGGTLILQAKLSGRGISGANDDAVFVATAAQPLRPLFRERGAVNTSKGLKTLKSFIAFSVVGGSPDHARAHTEPGRLTFLATFTDGSKALAEADGDTGALTARAEAGALVASGSPYRRKLFSVPANAGSEGVVLATVMDESGIRPVVRKGVLKYRGDGDPVVPMVGQPAVGFGEAGAIFSLFKDPVMAPGGSAIAFHGTVKGRGISSAKNTGLWVRRGDATADLQMVVRAGEQPPGISGGKWKAFTTIAMSPTFGPAFTATLVQKHGGVTAWTDSGLWVYNSAGVVQQLVREDETIDGKKVRVLTVLAGVPGTPEVSRSCGSDRVIFRATFHDGSQGIYSVYVP